jgi:hypothetical protein
LILGNHEVEVLVAADLAKFELSVRLDRHVEVALLAANFLLRWVLLGEDTLLHGLL